MARKSDGDLQLPTPWLEVTAPWKDDHQKSVLAWLPIPSLRHWKPDLVPEENHAPNPWWHFKSRGHRSACPVLWWPSSIAWMTHHRISSTALWRPARMWLSFFPWYTQSLHWNPNRPSSDASINRSPMWSLRNPCLAGDVRLLKAGHLHIQGMGWQESCDFSANTPEQWSGTDFMRQPPRPTQILFWIEWSSPAIMSENITLCPFVFLSFSPDGLCCRHLARPQSCSPTAGTNLFLASSWRMKVTHVTLLKQIIQPSLPLKSYPSFKAHLTSSLFLDYPNWWWAVEMSLIPTCLWVWSVLSCFSLHADSHGVSNVHAPFWKALGKKIPWMGPWYHDAMQAVTVISEQGMKGPWASSQKTACLSAVSKKLCCIWSPSGVFSGILLASLLINWPIKKRDTHRWRYTGSIRRYMR